MADVKELSSNDQILALLSSLNSKFTALDTRTANMVQEVKDVSSRITELEKDLAEGGSHNDSRSEKLDQETTLPKEDAGKDVQSQTSLFSKWSKLDPASSDFAQRKRPSSLDRNVDSHYSMSSPQPKKKRKRKSHVKEISSSDDDSESSSVVDIQMEELLDEYKTTKPKYLEDPTTSPIQDPLAKMLETWFWTVYSKDEVKTELAKSLRPENAPALIPTRINEAIFRSLSAQALSKDMPSRFIQNAFMKVSQSFVQVWSQLISLENFLKASDMELNTRFSPTLAIDFQLLRKHMDQGLRLLGIANSQMVVHRKETLSNYLNKDFKKICKSHVAFDQWMFGSNLKTLLEDTVRVNKLVQQNRPAFPSQGQTSFSKPFLRGRGGRGSRNNNTNIGQRRGGYQLQQGRGYGRGWQQNSSPRQQNQNSTGGNQNKQQIKR